MSSSHSSQSHRDNIISPSANSTLAASSHSFPKEDLALAVLVPSFTVYDILDYPSMDSLLEELKANEYLGDLQPMEREFYNVTEIPASKIKLLYKQAADMIKIFHEEQHEQIQWHNKLKKYMHCLNDSSTASTWEPLLRPDVEQYNSDSNDCRGSQVSTSGDEWDIQYSEEFTDSDETKIIE
ncbi:hypothetical protein BDQ17DRAFT_1437057 [Cyathus striatus]|nr:hypothetical protein BDQ17DRAFT_1437057 [Cyathus striatus]